MTRPINGWAATRSNWNGAMGMYWHQASRGRAEVLAWAVGPPACWRQVGCAERGAGGDAFPSRDAGISFAFFAEAWRLSDEPEAPGASGAGAA
jgi:hypothetical protein